MFLTIDTSITTIWIITFAERLIVINHDNNHNLMETRRLLSGTLPNGLGINFLQRRSTQRQLNEPRKKINRSLTIDSNDRNKEDLLKTPTTLESREYPKQCSRASTTETVGGSRSSSEQNKQKYELAEDWPGDDTTVHAAHNHLPILPVETGALDPETNEERFDRWHQFFDVGPLMRCLDTAQEREEFNDLLYESLLKEVQEPSPFKHRQPTNYRGVVQIRAFWEDVRKQLNINVAEKEEAFWPLGYPDYEPDRPKTLDALEDYPTSR